MMKWRKWKRFCLWAYNNPEEFRLELSFILPILDYKNTNV